MKKFLLIIASICLTFTIFLSGCSGCLSGADGRDGKDGHNVTIEEIYQKYLEESGDDISFEEFLRIYLNYTNEELDEATGLKSKINKSLMSGVTIYATFKYSTGRGGSTYQNIYTGSGAIIWLDKGAGDAYVVTNCHVIYDGDAVNSICQDVKLYLYGQDEYGVNFSVSVYRNFGYDDYVFVDNGYALEAEVIGSSITYDLALLKVTDSDVLKRSNALAAEFSDELDVKVGQTVYTIGNASDEGMSASSGIISKDSEYIDLDISSDDNYIEYRVMRITAPINSGNSGGALYDTTGKIIGIVNSKDDRTGIDNMGYALPGTSAKWLLQRMYDRYNRGTIGEISKAYLGVNITVSDSYAQFDEETQTAEIIQQIRIEAIESRTAASNSELAVGDYLKSFKLLAPDGTVKVKEFKITREYHLREAMLSVGKDDIVILTVERDGKEKEIQIIFNSDNYFTTVI